MDRLQSVFKGSQFGVGCSYASKKMVNFVRLGFELYPAHDWANSDFSNAFSSISRTEIELQTAELLPDVRQSTSLRLRQCNLLYYNGLTSGPAIIRAKTGVPQGAPKSPLDFCIGTQSLNRNCNILAGEDGNSRSYMDDNFTNGPTKNIHQVIRHQISEVKPIGMVLHPGKEKIALGNQGSQQKAVEIKQSYIDEFSIDPDNIFIHPADSPVEADKYGLTVMGIPVGSAEFVASSVSDSDSSPLVKLNQEFDSLLELSKYDPQLSFLFLRIVFAGKLTHFLRGLLLSQSEILAQLFWFVNMKSWKRSCSLQAYLISHTL